MTSYEFEVAAKNAAIKVMEEKHSISGVSISDVDFVWFAHELGFKKCTLWSPPFGYYYVEVTYNKLNHEMYVDVYLKQSNTLIQEKDFNYEAR